MKRYIVLFSLLILYSFFAFSQETGGALTGQVVDQAGSPVQGATITAIHTPSGTRYAVSTGADGRYRLDNLRIGGPYEVTASLVGKAPVSQGSIMVRLGGAQQVDLTMLDDVQQLEMVAVTARRAAEKANTYGAGQNISAEQVSNMPTISRSVTDITRQVPQGSKDNSFAGTNFRYNNVTVDGAINNDAIGFSPSLGGQTGTSGMPGSSTRTNPISLDAIQDMQVYLAPYDVKIGNFTGGSVNAVTRSGTNDVEGSVYGYGRNATITGNDRVGTLGSMESDFHDLQTGLRLGFPILKNKLFFFTNMEYTSRNDPTQLIAGTAETAHILSVADAAILSESALNRYGDIFEVGTPGLFVNRSRSTKFFGRIDWNINERHQLAIRNNTIFSKATHMDRDQQDFRFSSMAFDQTNNQVSTVAELKSRLKNNLTANFILGYTLINDYRDPQSDASLPQIQIQGRTPGTTIYLGTDREASIFDMRQRTLELTANLNWNIGSQRWTFGTHNELYGIRYGFVNGWNGRVDFLSIEDFLDNAPYRVRGSYNYENNNRDFIMDNPPANFDVNMYSVYVQNEIRVNDRLLVTPGLRADLAHLPTLPTLNEKVQSMLSDPDFGKTYFYTPVNRINNDFLNRVQFSPRIGVRWEALENRQLVVRGGAGLFTGRIPFSWLAYAYYNTGLTYGAFDQRAENKPFAPGSDAVRPSENGLANFIAENGVVVNDPSSGKTQVDLIDNGFTMPQVFRTSLGLDYTAGDGWDFTLEGIFTKNINDLLFQQVNTRDFTLWHGYDDSQQQPVYDGTVDERFTNVYLLSNTSEGYRYSITGTVSKRWKNLNATASYTFGESKDISNGVRNSMESNWQLNQSLVPNNPTLAYSNFDIRHRIVAGISYGHDWNRVGRTNVNLFFSAQSGSPFTYGIVNNSIQGLPQQVSLVYIPQRDDAIRYFKDVPGGQTAAQQAEAFNRFIDGNDYLSSRRGNFTERNTGRTPWNVQADLRLAHEVPVNRLGHSITISADIINVTNLLHRKWGVQYFSPNTFNSTSSVGLTPTLFPPQQNDGNWPVFTFSDPGRPYSIDYFNSRAQAQLGVRYTF
ncbi:Carboxypeptidase regulatory-like domain-containing protein [Parapedobacter composti]|uniref:Carboxypeptidase regulatory-like domain-containing protein n=1 Tax=Parapedobacter composti TaxID=623281 RepID=A0A1I1M787_9SPHI|nr:carboxypeptidase regulatory-like domain-containing protein [Parapedobacter composti]SFC78443.1 Carboxypeptidase regulatory-like domain-containing protein [Parapedobacter composti]